MSMGRTAGGLAVLVVAAGIVAAPAQAALPRVNMERALLAAQWDPQKQGTGITPGAKKSVLRIERALRRKGLLDRSLVDGHFGSSTVSAYAAWQRRLGYSGLGANGLPGETSLKKLGRGHFNVGHIVRPGNHTTYDGHTVNVRTKRMLTAAAHLISPTCTLDLTQGSYNPGGDPDSAGTHDGGGAADISVHHLCGAKRPRAIVRALRRVGFAAWRRPFIPDLWPEHIHAMAVNDPDLAPSAQEQTGDYYEGKNGLADEGPDHGPKVRKRTWEQYKRHH
jgi:hypothetical protein